MTAHPSKQTQISWSGLSSSASFDPRDQISPEERIRLETLLGASLRFFVLGVPFVLMWLAFGAIWPAAVITGGEFMNYLCWQGGQRDQNIGNWGWLMIGTLALVLAATSAVSGGINSPGLMWLCVLPLIGAFLYGLKGAIISGGLAISTGIGFSLLAFSLQTPVNLVPLEFRTIFALTNLIGASAAVLWLAHAWYRGIKHAEKSRFLSEAGFREALEQLPEAFLVLMGSRTRSPGFRVLYSNPAAEPILAPLKQHGLGLADCLPSTELNELINNIKAVHSNGRAFIKRGILHPINRRTYDLTVTRWGKGAVLCLHDATSRAQMETKLRKSNEQAVQVSKAKGDFLANMSHELRTPMNGILGMAELAMDTRLNEEQKDYLGTIHSCAENMGELIDSILDLSKMESGCLELEEQDFNLDELLDSVLDGLTAKASEKQLEWNAIRSHEVPAQLVGDSLRLKQVLTNLSGNALKFTERGEVAIEVQMKSANPTTVNVQFIVRDTGIGIPEEQVHRLFDKFTQADASITRKYGGSGLGLAISQKLVKAMGGEIVVDSTPGEGSTFSFTIPFRTSHVAATSPATPDALVGLRVLVVSTNRSNRRVLASQLRRLGCHYTCTASARQGSEMLRLSHKHGDPFSVLICDQRLEDQTGFEFANEIRQQDKWDELHFILMSSWCKTGDDALARSAGFEAQLLKPIKISSLQRELLRVLSCDNTSSFQTSAEGAAGNALVCRLESKKRVLLVEDNPVNRKLAMRMLEKLGLSIDVMENGEQALQAVKEHDYALVLMDCQMPVMDGYQATQKIRKLKSENSQVPIVAMTAHALQGDREKCMAAGMNDYIAKPVNQERLSLSLQRWLARAS